MYQYFNKCILFKYIYLFFGLRLGLRLGGHRVRGGLGLALALGSG